MLLNNHIDANKSKIRGYFYLKDIFEFCEAFKEVTKKLAFHLTLKTNSLQDIVYSSMEDDKNVTTNNLFLFVPNLMAPLETQLRFNEATQNNYKISFDEWYAERRVISDMVAQQDKRSAQQVNSPKYLNSAHQTKNRTNAPDKKNQHGYTRQSRSSKVSC